VASTTVRVRSDTRATLRQLAREANEPMQETLAKAVEAYRRLRLLEATNAAYARLHRDPSAWAEVEDERRLWESTLGDGLESE
jgi:hypothetical protein